MNNLAEDKNFKEIKMKLLSELMSHRLRHQDRQLSSLQISKDGVSVVMDHNQEKCYKTPYLTTVIGAFPKSSFLKITVGLMHLEVLTQQTQLNFMKKKLIRWVMKQKQFSQKQQSK